MTATSMTVKQMASGRMVDLANLDWTEIDFIGDVAPGLARICRFDGAMRCMPYSVAQHCVLMADTAMDENGDANLAAACLLHDAHEAYLGDLTVPAVALLVSHGVPRSAIQRAKEALDKAIFRAAGIPAPNVANGTTLSILDIRMLAMERKHLLEPSDRPWAIDALNVMPIRMRGAIRPWPVARAEMEWLDRLATLCPSHHVASPATARRTA